MRPRAAGGRRGSRPRAFAAEIGRSPGSPKDEPSVAGDEAGRDQLLAERRSGDRLAIDLRDQELADATVVDERLQHSGRGRADVAIVRRRQDLDRSAAAFEVERGHAVDEDDIGTGGAL